MWRLDLGENACALGAAYKAVWATERKVYREADLAERFESFEGFIAERWDEDSFAEKVGVGYERGVFERYGEAMVGFEMMEAEIVAEMEKVGREEMEEEQARSGLKA